MLNNKSALSQYCIFYMTFIDLYSGYWQSSNFPSSNLFGLKLEDKSYFYWVWYSGCCASSYHIYKPFILMHLLKGKRANIFIDDLLSTCQGYHLALLQDKFIWTFFGEEGWVFKPSTSSGLPSQKVTYLGYLLFLSRWNFRFHLKS